MENQNQNLFLLKYGEKKIFHGWTIKVSKNGNLTVQNPQGLKVLDKFPCDSYHADDFSVKVIHSVFYDVAGQRYVIQPGQTIDHKSVRLSLNESGCFKVIG